MNPKARNRPLHGLLAGLSSLALAALAACGSGGGGGGSLTVTSTIFGYDPFTGNFDASGQQGEAPIVPQNMCVVFTFSDSILASSVSAASIVVAGLDASGAPTIPAACEFEVIGNRVIICPLISFSDTNVTFGFDPDTTYEILFQTPPSAPVVTSVHGKSIAAKDRGPYFFKTSSTIFDQNPGAPVPTITLLDAAGNDLGSTNVASKPVPIIKIAFDEPVLPPTAVDPGFVGTSSAIHVELDVDFDDTTTADRISIPGLFVLSETNSSATVIWTSLLTEIPTDPVTGCLYVVTVDGSVQDLSGHSKITETNDPGANDTLTFTTAPGSSTVPADPVVEEFDVQDNSDAAVTSAKWGTVFTGFLSSGVGGGTGIDGDFDPTDPAFLANLPTDVTLTGAQTLTMATAHLGVRRVYEFTNFFVPTGWTVIGSGVFPLEIQCSGSVSVDGILDVSGAAGAIYVTGQVGGGAGGIAALGGTAGGKGGATTDANGVDTFFPAKGLGTTYPNLAYTGPVGGVLNQGLSGRSVTALTPFSFTDALFGASLAALNVTNLWVQPNVAADDFRFERTHTSFKVESIVAGGIVTVVSSALSADYRGELSQETINPYIEADGSGGFRAPLLAEKFDSYVIGELTGFPGGGLFDFDFDGVLDDATVFVPGSGSSAQSVMQTFMTLGRSGGGGGGGSVLAGSNGDDDPTVAGGAGSFGGTGNVGAPGGTAAPTGTILSRVSPTTLDVQNNFFDDGTGAPNTSYVGQLINPDIGQGHTFVIAAVVDLNTCTVLPVNKSDGTTIDLNDVAGLGLGDVFRITAPYFAGGTGGGGAGVHCAGSSKNPAGHAGHPSLADPKQDDDGLADGNGGTQTAGFYDDDDNKEGPTVTQDGKEDGSEPIFTLPRWIPGGGGGAGGGALRIVAAGNISVANNGSILSEGGEGGRSDGTGINAATGGGGGSGGTVFLGAGGSLSVALGSQISCAGGTGGAVGFGIEGGDGAPGRIRLEDALGSLAPSDFAGVTTPTITAEDLGEFPGGGESLAQSIFMPSGVLLPNYTKLTFLFDATKDGTPEIGLTYIVNRDGSTDDGSGNPGFAPFDVLMSFTVADAATGLADASQATPFADPTIDPLSNHDGEAYVRFKIVLPDASLPVNVGGATYSNIRVDSITIDLDSVKP